MMLPRAGRALASANFRLFFGGQLISLCGTWLQQVAMTWLVWEMTGSKWLLGLVAFSGQIPTLFLSPIAGALTETWDRRKALLITQTLAMLQALAVAALTLTDTVRVEYIIPLAIFLGAVNAFDMPIRQAFLTQMIDRREDLPNAIALNSSMVNSARLVGPAIAGLLITLVGEGWCFLLNGLSYLAVLAALAAMRINRPVIDAPRARVWEALHGGFSYAFRSVPIRSLLTLLATVSLTGIPLNVLMPVFASEVLGGDAGTLGMLTTSTGVGALTSAVYLASRKSIVGLGLQIGLAAGGLGIAMICFSFSHHLFLSMGILIASGFCMMLQMAASNTLLQTIVDENMRGRVMGLYAMSLLGVAPIGSLMAGALAQAIGAPTTILICGSACCVSGLMFLARLKTIREHARPIYVRLGIIPEIATALQQTSQMNVPPQRS
jgi:MFS family permease